MSESDGSPLADEYRADAASLRSFVVVVEQLLQAIVDDGRYIPKHHLAAVREAWPHARSDLQNLAGVLAQEAMDPVKNESGDTPRSKLEKHGLTGPSLRMKLDLWRARIFAFGSRMNRRWLRTTLRWTDTILGSIVDAMTLGAAGKEFKEAIEHLLSPDERNAGQDVPPKRGRTA